MAGEDDELRQRESAAETMIGGDSAEKHLPDLATADGYVDAVERIDDRGHIVTTTSSVIGDLLDALEDCGNLLVGQRLDQLAQLPAARSPRRLLGGQLSP